MWVLAHSIACLVAMSTIARAEPPLTTRFAVTQWGVEDGLPQSSVTGIAQGPSGYLWVGTFGGLARFDGARFVLDDGEGRLPDVRVTALATAPDGTLWVGTQHGGVARMTGDAIVTPDDLAMGTIWALAADAAGAWATTDGGLYRWEADRWRREDVDVATLVRSGDQVWAGGHELARLSDSPQPATLPADTAVLDLQLDPETGVLWVGTDAGVAARAPDGRWTVLPLEEPGHEILLDASGRLWVGGVDSLVLLGLAEEVRRSGQPERRASWAFGARVRTMFQDREGNLWVGTDGAGLVRLIELPFARYLDGLPEPSVRVLDASGPRVLAAAGCGSLSALDDDGRFAPVPGPAGRALGCVGATAQTGRGVLWVGHENRVASIPGDEETELPGRVLALLEHDGELWVGTEGAGAWTVHDGEATPVAGLEKEVVSSVVAGPDGAKWFALWGGVAVLRDGQLRTWGEADGLPRAQVRAIHVDPDGAAWLGTYGGGLVRISGDEVARVGVADGLPEDIVSAVLADDLGHLWLNGNRGVHRVARSDLANALRGAGTIRALSFPTGEGNGGSSPSAGVDSRGHLWFATLQGAVAFDPADVTPNVVAPIPVVEEVFVDGRSLPRSGGWSAPPGHRDMVVGFTAAALRDPPNTRFRHRLYTNVATEWKEGGPSRQVQYGHLPPGAYTFEVAAANEVGVWSDRPARIEFVLRPWLWETLVFRVAVVLLGLTGLSGLIWLRMRGTRLRNEALQEEIEYRRRVEAALRVSEAHYRGTFEAASDALLVTTRAGRIIDANAAAVALFGRPVRDLRERTRADLVAEADDAATGVRVDGTRFSAQASTVELGADLRLTSVVDLEPSLQVQRRLAVAERMEAIGRLAGGVAHDINNLLMVVSANAEQLALEAHRLSPRAAVSIDQVARAATRGADVTRSLLSFGQRQLLRSEPIDIGAMLAHLEPSLRHLLRDGVQLEIVCHGRPEVRSDRSHLELAVVNLVMNAVDATASGRITIEARTLSGSEARERWAGPSDEIDWIVLAVSDTGAGIPAEVLPKLFEPFYTTKGDLGTGLGLPSVHGFASQSGGFVFARSDLGQGSVFELLLPAADVVQPEHPPIVTTDPAESRETAPRVLVCDDDPLVLRSMSMLLRGARYRVRTACSGQEALALLDEEPADLLVTDVVMPEMDGAELSRRARDRHSELKVIFVSGYTRDLVAADLDGDLLVKPFTRAQLLEVVDRTLAAST